MSLSVYPGSVSLQAVNSGGPVLGITRSPVSLLVEQDLSSPVILSENLRPQSAFRALCGGFWGGPYPSIVAMCKFPTSKLVLFADFSGILVYLAVPVAL